MPVPASRSRGLLRAGARGAAIACALTAAAASAQPARDPRDARIDALEAQVRTLTGMVEALARAPRPSPAAVPPPPAQAVAAASRPAQSGIPPSRGPDQARPVTSSDPGESRGVASFEGGHPSIQSADGKSVATLHGSLHFDAAGYFQKAAGPLATDLRRGGSAGDSAHARDLGNGTIFRRARIGIDGRLFGAFEYNVLFDFGGSGVEDAGHIFELWAQYSGVEPLHLRIGAFAPSIGLEDQNSVNGMPLLERPAIVDIARGIAASDFREAVQLSAHRDRWFAAAALTTHTIATINTSSTGAGPSFDQSLGVVGRVAAIPFQGEDWLVHVGAHASRVLSVADTGGPDVEPGSARYTVQLRERPELRVDGTRLIDTGAIAASHADEAGLELAVQRRNLYLQGEYETIRIERRNSALRDPRFGGWYVEGGWVLTGERRKYNTGTFAFDAPPVAHPFDPSGGGGGAVELVGRYSLSDLNSRQGAPGTALAPGGVRGGEQEIIAAGINWYLNPIIRLMVDYQHVDIDRLAPSAAFATPVGARIGQSYDTIAVRTQLAF